MLLACKFSQFAASKRRHPSPPKSIPHYRPPSSNLVTFRPNLRPCTALSTAFASSPKRTALILNPPKAHNNNDDNNNYKNNIPTNLEMVKMMFNFGACCVVAYLSLMGGAIAAVVWLAGKLLRACAESIARLAANAISDVSKSWAYVTKKIQEETEEDNDDDMGFSLFD